MWIDVLSKSKSLTGNGKGTLARLKMGMNVFIAVLLVLAVGFVFAGMTSYLAMFCFLMIFMLMFVFKVL